jgi:hypothetical protein
MSRLRSDYNNYIPPSTTAMLYTGPGKVHCLLVSIDSAPGTVKTVTLYDSTGALTPIIAKICVSDGAPHLIAWPDLMYLRFVNGLTVVTSANIHVTLVTEA